MIMLLVYMLQLNMEFYQTSGFGYYGVLIHDCYSITAITKHGKTSYCRKREKIITDRVRYLCSYNKKDDILCHIRIMFTVTLRITCFGGLQQDLV